MCVSLEKVDKFCYLGNMLGADGGCDSAVTASQICLESFVNTYPFSLKLKGNIYATCVSCLMHGSET